MVGGGIQAAYGEAGIVGLNRMVQEYQIEWDGMKTLVNVEVIHGQLQGGLEVTDRHRTVTWAFRHQKLMVGQGKRSDWRKVR